jgi:hypothetical protein
MEILSRNIKLMKAGDYHYLGEAKKPGYVIHHMRGNNLGARFSSRCGIEFITTGSITITINNNQTDGRIKLTKDNILFFGTRAIDLNKKIIFITTAIDRLRYRKNLSDRTHITLKNS